LSVLAPLLLITGGSQPIEGGELFLVDLISHFLAVICGDFNGLFG